MQKTLRADCPESPIGAILPQGSGRLHARLSLVLRRRGVVLGGRRCGGGDGLASLERADAAVEVVTDEGRLDLEGGHLEAGLVGPDVGAELAVHDHRVAATQRAVTVLSEGAPGVHGVPLGVTVLPGVGTSLVATGCARYAEGGDRHAGRLADRHVTAQPAGQGHEGLEHVSPRGLVANVHEPRTGTDSAGWCAVTLWRDGCLSVGCGRFAGHSSARARPSRTVL